MMREIGGCVKSLQKKVAKRGLGDYFNSRQKLRSFDLRIPPGLNGATVVCLRLPQSSGTFYL